MIYLKSIAYKFFNLFFLLLILHSSAIKAQQHSDSVAVKKDTAMATMIALRNDFIGRIKSMLYVINFNQPEIVADNPHYFENYDKENNVIHTGDWNTLPDEQKELFSKYAGEYGKGITGEAFFTSEIHRWLFIHQMAQWWRAVRQDTSVIYKSEMAANRITIAYWRERDPAFLEFMLKWFQHVAENSSSPVPKNASKEQYFNENYNKPLKTSDYNWLQANMIMETSHETPALPFRQSIKRLGKPFTE